jgi:hypothetical protein
MPSLVAQASELLLLPHAHVTCMQTLCVPEAIRVEAFPGAPSSPSPHVPGTESELLFVADDVGFLTVYETTSARTDHKQGSRHFIPYTTCIRAHALDGLSQAQRRNVEHAIQGARLLRRTASTGSDVEHFVGELSRTHNMSDYDDHSGTHLRQQSLCMYASPTCAALIPDTDTVGTCNPPTMLCKWRAYIEGIGALQVRTRTSFAKCK